MNSSAQLTRTERLDRLPVTPKHKRLLVGSGIGWALDAMDIGLVSFILAALAAQWNLDNTTTGWIASVGFVGMAIGASLGGLLADKIGRRIPNLELPWSSVHTLITDERLSDEARTSILARGVKLICVAVEPHPET